MRTWHSALPLRNAGTARSRIGNTGGCEMLVAEVTRRQEILGLLEEPGAAMWCRSRAREPCRSRRQGERPDVVRRGAG